MSNLVRRSKGYTEERLYLFFVISLFAGALLGIIPQEVQAHDQANDCATQPWITLEGGNIFRPIFGSSTVMAPDFDITKVTPNGNKEQVEVKNLCGAGILEEVSCWQDTLAGPRAYGRPVNIPLPPGATTTVEISSLRSGGTFTCSVAGVGQLGFPEPHTDNNSFRIERPGPNCARPPCIAPPGTVTGGGNDDPDDPGDDPTPPPLNIEPGLFIDRDSVAWLVDPFTEKGGRSVVRQTTGITVTGPTGSFVHGTRDNWVSRYMFFGDKNHLLILDSSTAIGQVDHSVSLINFTTAPPSEVFILSASAIDHTVPPPNVQYSQKGGDAFLIYSSTGNQIANTAIYRSDVGARLCAGPGPFIATGETQGEATASELLIHYAINNQNYKVVCSLQNPQDRQILESIPEPVAPPAVTEIAPILPEPAADCIRPTITDLQATLPPEGSTAAFRLHFRVAGANRVEIFGNVQTLDPQGYGYFDVWQTEPGNWIVWAKLDGTPADCYAERGLYVTPGAATTPD